MKKLIETVKIVLAKIVRAIFVPVAVIALLGFLYISGNILRVAYVYTDHFFVNIPDHVGGPLLLNLVFTAAIFLVCVIVVVKTSDVIRKQTIKA